MSDQRCLTKPTSIYICCDPVTHEPRYVGKTVRKVEHRIRNHVSRSFNTHASRWFNKVKNPYYFVVEIVPPGGDWIEAEQFWIAYMKSLGARLTNMTVGGEGLTGRDMPEEVREKIGAANRGQKRGPLSPETCAKMSESRRGKKRPPRSPETIEKMRLAQLGKKRPRTAEHQAKLTALQTGRKKGPNSKEHNEKISKANKGQVRTEEARLNMSIGQSLSYKLNPSRSELVIERNKSRVWDEEAREKNRQASLNRTDEARENMSKGQKARFAREKAEKEQLFLGQFSEETDIEWCENE